jgi:hypothetical protein
MTKAKLGWRCSSSGRALAYQILGPKFKPQYHQIKERQKEINTPNSTDSIYLLTK